MRGRERKKIIPSSWSFWSEAVFFLLIHSGGKKTLREGENEGEGFLIMMILNWGRFRNVIETGSLSFSPSTLPLIPFSVFFSYPLSCKLINCTLSFHHPFISFSFSLSLLSHEIYHCLKHEHTRRRNILLSPHFSFSPFFFYWRERKKSEKEKREEEWKRKKKEEKNRATSGWTGHTYTVLCLCVLTEDRTFRVGFSSLHSLSLWKEEPLK